MFPHFWDTLYRKRFTNVSLCGTKRNIFRKIFSIWDEKNRWKRQQHKSGMKIHDP